MRSFSASIITVAAASMLLCAAPAFAQNEAALREDLEGRRVRLKIDMPGTQEGVDLQVDARRPMNYPEYGDRLKRFGVALRKGDTATITLVKVKKDLIEFQLDGGGFGTLTDNTDTSANIPFVQKSNREKDLEKLVKDENDRARRRKLQEELDDLRDRRERENRRITVERARIEERKRERVMEQRFNGGSRFNLRWDRAVPRNLTAEDIMDALSEYLSFVRR